ncbi:MAG: hypothetical protein K6G75_09770 [Lachnospiraceae bacterium]|nr:hypothetical protein [Lachnospiraceae bacterium]
MNKNSKGYFSYTMVVLAGKKLISIIIAVIFLTVIVGLIVAGILTFKPLHYQTDYSNDVSWLCKNLDGVVSGEYNTGYECWNIFGTTQVAPGAAGDKDYYGYIRISEEEAEKLCNEYNWSVSKKPMPNTGNINLTSYDPNDWYVCKDFTDDKFPGLGITDVRFDKTDTIVFSTEH